MTAEQAVEITFKIKTSVTNLAKLVKQARDGKAWKALGFETFELWVNESFGWHRSRAYQLINIASLDDELHELIELPEDWSVSDRQTRKINEIGSKDFLELVRSRASEDPNENVKLINSLITYFSNLTVDNQVATEVLPTPPQIVQSSPSSITNGIRDSRTALVMASSLEQQTKSFPLALDVAPSVKVQVIRALEIAAADAKARLEAYDAAVEERRMNRVADAH